MNRIPLYEELREVAREEAQGPVRAFLLRAADRLETYSVMGARGQWTRLLDRNGDRVCIGDILGFDSDEWGSECVFEVGYSDGELDIFGTPSDISEYCWIVKKWSDS